LAPAPAYVLTVEDVVDCATQIAGDVFERLRIDGIEFFRDIEPGLPLRKPGCLTRALLNLFLRAGEEMRQGGIIEIRARSVDGRIEISVADNGPGIPAGILPSILKSSCSVRGAHHAGLHTVDSIVRRNGGRIVAANRSDNSGAEFLISIPT
jgi:signal transduction histidine kinase